MKSRLVCFANSAVSIECADELSASLVDFLFGTVPAKGSADPHIHYSLEYDSTADSYHLDSDHAHDKKIAPRGRMAHHLMERVTYHLADRSSGGMVLHAACLEKDGAALLLPANSGAGKSSLTVWLALHGWHYLTDELAFLPESSSQIQGFTRPVHLKGNTVDLFPTLNLQGALPIRPDFPDHNAWLVPPATLNRQGQDPPTQPITSLQTIIFPRYSAQSENEFTLLTPADAAIRLTASLINARNLTDNGFPQMLLLARETQAYACIYNQFPDPSLFADL